MTPKRPPARRYNTGSSSSSNERSHKRARTAFSPSPVTSDSEQDSDVLKVYLVQAKLGPAEITELYQLVESCPEHGGDLHLQLVPEVIESDIIITAVRMKRRLERHVDWKIARQKAIVTPQWLKDSVEAGHGLPCGKYAAIGELIEETIENCPDPDNCDDCSHSHDHPRSQSMKPPSSAKGVANPSPAVEPTPARVHANWRARYVCQRASPLKCPNQDLVEALSVLCRDRELEGLHPNALAYQRAVAVIKSYPHKIDQDNLESEVSKLPGMGGKIFSKVQEFLEKGSISEVQETLASDRYQTLSTFATIYGIGPGKAQHFYDMGMRTISDLERYYDIDPPSAEEGYSATSVESMQAVERLLREMEDWGYDVTFTPNGKRVPSKTSKRGNKPPDLTVPVALALRGEFDLPIPREEVEEMRDVVMRELDELQPGCVSTIVGGYRRGKPQSNDVDIVFSHTDWENGAEIIKGLCTRLTAHMHRKGLITHVMHLSGFHAHDALKTDHWDSLEKSLCVFRLPETPTSGPRLHRRLDLIFAAPQSYWTAVIGWTGSKMFQRDLRLWAKQERGMKFDSNGLTRRHDTRLYLPKSEKEVFSILGLDWIDPTMRNADV
uniref:DNA polymerase n=1 Tax=Coprinopsis cinerea TaxID=5346 RepID=Q5FBD6_COPCI|nr:DNA polymerase mu [Coprinopsis cinerea]